MKIMGYQFHFLLLPRNFGQGKISQQFAILSGQAGISSKIFNDIMNLMLSQSDNVEKLLTVSFLNDTTKRNYRQSYQDRLKQLIKRQVENLYVKNFATIVYIVSLRIFVMKSTCKRNG